MQQSNAEEAKGRARGEPRPYHSIVCLVPESW